MTNSKAGMRPNRRQFVVAASAMGLLSTSGLSALAAAPANRVTWKGAALGAEAIIELYHPDPQWAQGQLVKCQNEINRLENLFSLYRVDSSISRLNEDGILKNPDIDFVQLLSRAKSLSEISGGAFDVTVQPMWKLYAEHFKDASADPRGPTDDKISNTLDLIGSQHIQVDLNQIAFSKAGMGVTFNGIAQGFITDKITQILRDAGFDNVLVSLGEQYALGTKPNAQKWRVGIASSADGQTIEKIVELQDAAIATSGGYGSPFSPNSSLNHLIDPRTGTTAKLNESVSVIAQSAATADAFSTALSLMSRDEGEKLIAVDPTVTEVIYT